MPKRAAQIHSVFLRLLPGFNRRRIFWPAAFVLFVIYACLPLLSQQSAIESALSSQRFVSTIDEAKQKVIKGGQSEVEERVFLYSVSPFAEVSVPYRISWKLDPAKDFVASELGKPSVSLKLDQVVLAAAIMIMVALTVSTAMPDRNDGVSEGVATRPTEQIIATVVPATHSTAREVFAQEVKLAAFRAETLFKRSTYLLTGGVLMAFVGVAVFYATLPEPLRDEVQSSYWIRALRSAGMLIFLEAIAWFLLRQYRNLIEDFKSFHRIYMKRANYLAAITILDKDAIRGEDILIVSALLGEDFSGKLSSGETTESLENIKSEGVNPVFNLVHDAMAKAFSRSSASKPSAAESPK